MRAAGGEEHLGRGREVLGPAAAPGATVDKDKDRCCGMFGTVNIEPLDLGRSIREALGLADAVSRKFAVSDTALDQLLPGIEPPLFVPVAEIIGRGRAEMKLYTYYRSQASFRVRIALNLKGIAREDSFLHLEKGDQFAATYEAINPQMVVPTLIDGDTKLRQSLAILEYLDEAYPEPPLLPPDPLSRARVRGIALINVADSHPLIVPRVRHYLTDVLKISDEQRLAWIQHWLGAGLQAIETLLAEHSSSGGFCHGDQPTIADICIPVDNFYEWKEDWGREAALCDCARRPKADGSGRIVGKLAFAGRRVGTQLRDHHDDTKRLVRRAPQPDASGPGTSGLAGVAG
jgi:maleylacetoacetate isomerase